MRVLTPDLAAFWVAELARLSPTERAHALASLVTHYGPDVEQALARAAKVSA